MAIKLTEEEDVTRCQAITNIISSVAKEETAISYILTAESEKIMKFIADDSTATYEEILQVNESVKSMIGTITNLEIVLKDKLELFSDSLSDYCEA